MTARAFFRHASPQRGAGRAPAASATAPVLRVDEVSRHAVRLVTIGRVADALGITAFGRLPDLLGAGDLLVVNDAATLPASLRGRTASGAELELRLCEPIEASRLVGVLFGAGDHRTRTEDRAPPPPLEVGEHVTFGTAGEAELVADVTRVVGRRVELAARVGHEALVAAVYATGVPVQYAHRLEPLPLHAVQTAYAARPWAMEMPSAGRPLTWDVLLGLRRRGVAIASLTHAAGLSSTGAPELDHALPWPERYDIPRETVNAIGAARGRGGRVIAVGTTVVRALEHASHRGELEPGRGVATLRLDARHALRVVDGLISGLHVPGESHFELLSAFVPGERLARALALAAAQGLSSHELGDACLIL